MIIVMNALIVIYAVVVVLYSFIGANDYSLKVRFNGRQLKVGSIHRYFACFYGYAFKWGLLFVPLIAMAWLLS